MEINLVMISSIVALCQMFCSVSEDLEMFGLKFNKCD